MKSFRLTILTALAALILLIGCGGSDNSAKYGKLLFERDLATTTVNMNIHQPVLIFKKDSMESADYNITYKIEEQSEIHACHKAHSKVVSLQIIDSEGNERLNYSDTEGCRNIDLEPGTYTVKLGTLPSSNLFVYNKTADSKTCSNVNSCIDLINQSGGCTNCTFSHFFLSPDLDKPTTKMDFTNHDFSGTSWTNGVIIQADFNGSDFSGGIFGDSCNGDSCTADTDGVFGAKNSFSSCKFNSTRFNAGKLSGDYSHSTFSDASLSNMWDFLFLSSDQNQTDASKIIKEFYSERYGSGHEFNLTQFGIDTIKSGGVNYYEDTSVLDHIDFSTASVGDDKSNLGLFENASMQGVTFPSKGKMDLNGINLYKTDLTGVDFSSTGSEMAEADLRYADLTDVDFSGKDLVNAKLGCNTKMNGTDLSNVDINNLDYSSIKEKECVIEADGIIIGPNINFNNTTFQKLLK